MVIERIDPAALLWTAIFSTLIFGVWIKVFSRLKVVTAVVLVLIVNWAVFGRLLMTQNIENTFSESISAPQLPPLATDHASLQIFIFAMFSTVNLGLVLLTKLYRSTIQGRASAAELETGIAGIRAWLSPFSIVTVVCFAFAGYVGFNWQILSGLFLGACLLLAFPLINTLLNRPTENSPSPQAPAEERQRVLALVETGKITADDAAELLSALAQSQVASVEATGVMSGPRRLIIAGAIAVLIAFFMPWFTLNESQAMQEAMGDIRQNFPQVPAGVSSLGSQTQTSDGQSVAVPVQHILHVVLRGGDVRNELGWVTLAAGLCAAGLPFFWTPRGDATQMHRNIILAALAVGTVAVVYLLTNSFNAFTSIEPGFMIVMTGHGILWVGAVREYIPHGARFRAATATA